jgi:quinol monooxygenase YgiN
MDKIRIVANVNIHDGKLDEFKQLASDAIEMTKQKEPGTLQYEWFFNHDETKCVVLEEFETSATFLIHATNMKQLLSEHPISSDMTIEIFGNPSPELADMLHKSSRTVYGFFGGVE